MEPPLATIMMPVVEEDDAVAVAGERKDMAPQATEPGQEDGGDEEDVEDEVVESAAPPPVEEETGPTRRPLPLWYLKAYPLHRAVESGDVEDVRVLLTMQPSLLNATTKPLQRTAAMEAARLNNHEVLCFLCKAGADVSRADCFGDTLLHHCCRHMGLPSVQALVEDYKVRVNVRGHRGMTPLHHAAQRGRAEVVRWLLGKARADPTVEDEQGRRASSVVMGAVLGQGLDNALVRQARDRLVDLMQFHEAKWEHKRTKKTARPADTAAAAQRRASSEAQRPSDRLSSASDAGDVAEEEGQRRASSTAEGARPSTPSPFTATTAPTGGSRPPSSGGRGAAAPPAGAGAAKGGTVGAQTSQPARPEDGSGSSVSKARTVKTSA